MASGVSIGPAIDLAAINPDGYARLTRVKDGVLLYNRFDQFIGRSIELYGEYCGARVDLFRQIEIGRAHV